MSDYGGVLDTRQRQRVEALHEAKTVLAERKGAAPFQGATVGAAKTVDLILVANFILDGDLGG